MVNLNYGTYVELEKVEIEFDGDYLIGYITLKIASNSFINSHRESFPDCYGHFIHKGKSVEPYRKALVKEMQDYLTEQFKFDNEEVSRLLGSIK